MTINANSATTQDAYQVGGKILNPDGTPVIGATVKVYDKGLTADTSLGAATADAAGAYSITFTAGQFPVAQKKKPDLLVRAFGSDGKEIAASPIRFNAQQIESIDLVVGNAPLRGPSAFQKLTATIDPLAKDLDPGAFTAEQIDFLVNKTGQPKEQIDSLKQASRFAKQIGIDPQALYALFQKGLPSVNLPSLLRHPLPVLKRVLESAVQDNLVPVALKDKLPKILDQLHKLMVDQAFQPTTSGRASFGELLGTSTLKAPQQRKLVSLLAAHEGNAKDFWTTLGKDPDFAAAADVEEVRSTLRFIRLSQNYLPMVQVLQQMRSQGKVKSPSDLARLDAKDWLERIKSKVNGKPVGYPPDQAGENDEAKAKNYAEALFRQVEAVFPTQAVACQLPKTTWPKAADLASFLQANPDFDLGTTSVDRYLSKKTATGKKAKAIGDDVKRELKTLQRLFRVSPRLSHMQALKAAGIGSAKQIAEMSRASFVERCGEALGSAVEAEAIHASATQRNALALSLFGRYGWELNQLSPALIAPPPVSAAEIPNWSSLFGSPSYCECKDCQSVSSPAAYLVDLLQFLKHESVEPESGDAQPLNAFDALANRRPDIPQILLSCANTNTPLPYVDLVNEILERIIRPPPSSSAWPQTTWTADELAANPEHVNGPVYDQVLKRAIYPWNLPFDLNGTEAQTYLGHLGVPRYLLMEAFSDAVDSGFLARRRAVLTNLEIVREYLGMARAEWNLFATNSTATVEAMWGVGQAELSSLSACPVFLKRAKLSFTQMTELFQLVAVNPGNQMSWSPTHSCNLDEITLTFGSDDTQKRQALRRVCLFLRLQRRLGWSPQELDQALRTFPSSAFDGDFLKKCSHIQRLRQESKIPLHEMLCWWGNIPTAARPGGEPSLFEQIFLNKVVLRPSGASESDEQIFRAILNNASPPPNEKISQHLPRIGAALGMKASAILLIAVSDQDALTLQNLSLLYRISSICRAFKLSVPEYLALRSLTGLDPFNPLETENAILFSERVDKIRGSESTVAEIHYLLQHRIQSSASAEEGLRGATIVLEGLRQGLLKIAEEHTIPATADQDLFRTHALALSWPESLVKQAIATLEDREIYRAPLSSPPKDFFELDERLLAKVAYLGEQHELTCSGVMTSAERRALLTVAPSDPVKRPEYQNAVNLLFNAPRTFALAKLRAIEPPLFVTHLEQLPSNVRFPDLLQDTIVFDRGASELRYRGLMTTEEKDRLVSLSDTTAGQYRAAVDALFRQSEFFRVPSSNCLLRPEDLDSLFDSTERFSYLLRGMLSRLRVLASERFLVQQLAAILKVDLAIVQKLLTVWATPPAPSPLPLPAANLAPRPIFPTPLSVFLDSRFIEGGPLTRERLSEQEAIATARSLQYQMLAKLQKMGGLLSRFRLGFKEARYLFESRPSGWLNLDSIPATVDGAAASYAGWERLIDALRLRERLGLADPDLFDLFDMAKALTLDQLGQRLCDRMAWDTDGLCALNGRFGFSLSAYQDERAYLLLEECFRLAKRMGVSIAKEDIVGWSSAPEISLTAANQIKQAAKGRYEYAQWLQIARPLQNPVREKKRGALVSYLTGKWNWTEDQLYGHFLIDVEMSPCMMTSRVKQAIGSIQLFVQRCLLGMEPGVQLRSEGVRWWNKWMKYYRVWEANRKVFLFPENWIEPDLRDDKSPFFEELENELRQEDITPDTAERAFLHYLEKLNAVSQPLIVAHYFDKEGGTYYLFGRTQSTPPKYFFRTRDPYRVWSGWTEIPLDIEGDHLVPYVWNRRLHLFWPLFKEATQKGQTSSIAGSTGSEPGKCWEIQLAWSACWGGKWEPKQISSCTMRPERPAFVLAAQPKEPISVLGNGANKQYFFFRANATDNGLRVYCHYLRTDQENAFTTAQNALLPVSITWQSIPSGFDSQAKTLLANYPGTFSGWAVGIYLQLDHIQQTIQYILTHLLDRTSFGDPPGDYVSTQVDWLVDYKANIGALYQRWGYARNLMETLSNSLPESVRAGLANAWGDVESSWSALTMIFPSLENACDSIRSYDSRTKRYFLIDEASAVSTYQAPAQITEEFEPISVFSPGTSLANMAMQNTDESHLHGQNLRFKGRLRELRGDNIPTYVDSKEFWHEEGTSHTVFPSQELMIWHLPFIYQDFRRTLLALPWLSSTHRFPLTDEDEVKIAMGDVWGGLPVWCICYEVETHFHPYAKVFLRELGRQGIDGLLKPGRDSELFRQRVAMDFFTPGNFVPSGVTFVQPYPRNEVSFASTDAYSLYNWEIFFHAPLMIADRLSKNQQFEAAQKWFHTIFDPTDVYPSNLPQRGAWRLKPFFENLAATAGVEDLLKALNAGDQQLIDEVRRWRATPFNPHLLARLRYAAYQKTVVMKYIDNLIAWADQLFRRDTIESINEATQLYLLAATILGPKPQALPARQRTDLAYANLEEIDEFSNALVVLENELASQGTANAELGFTSSQVSYSLVAANALQPAAASHTVTPVSSTPSVSAADNAYQPSSPNPGSSFLYFGVPRNDLLNSYWDTVADRLFKIRHCMNIEGVVRQLPLFEPPIDPALLVRAAAAGVDLSTVLSDLSAPLPHYRFTMILQKATELCGQVQSLGAALLAALEKRDAEALSLLRAGREAEVLESLAAVKKQQIDEAEATLDSLTKTRELVELRAEHYANLQFMNPSEKAQLKLMSAATIVELIAQFLEAAASAARQVPETAVGSSGLGPHATAQYGGANIAEAMSLFARGLNMGASLLHAGATKSSILAGYQRRQEEWDLQKRLATKELQQIDKQIAAAEIRVAIAEQDRENQTQQIENAKEVHDYLKTKFTNQALYDWQISQLSTVYFQSYQLVYDLAKRAERAYQHELAEYGQTFVKFGYWDSLKKGLLAGEKLLLDLKRMDAAYLDHNRREFELVKHVSLAMLDPVALVTLKQTGSCFVQIPEAIFDLDYPGHYLRRLKSVSLTIPCVTGPYTGVHCTLTLLSNSVRIKADLSNGAGYSRAEEGDDPRFRDAVGVIQSIATSSGQNDAGLFELSFRDERYLPFEGAGAISTWRLELSDALPQFNFDTMTDVILHIHYTARDGGAGLREAAAGDLAERLAGSENLLRMFSAKHEFPSEFHRFLHAPTGQNPSMALDLCSERFPYLGNDKAIQIKTLELFAKCTNAPGQNLTIGVTPPNTAVSAPVNLASDPAAGNLLHGVLSLAGPANPGVFLLQASGVGEVTPINDILVICKYAVMTAPPQ